MRNWCWVRIFSRIGLKPCVSDAPGLVRQADLGTRSIRENCSLTPILRSIIAADRRLEQTSFT